MNSCNLSLKPSVDVILERYEAFKVATEDNEENVHQILESVGMQLSSNLLLAYSRRKKLWQSFYESHQKPLIIIDSDAKSFVAVISETSIIRNGKELSCFYSSDLRMRSTADRKVKLGFRNLYIEIVKQMKKFCYTSILSENTAALKALTSKSNPVFYNKLFEYTSRTFFILPWFNFSKLNLERVTDTNREQYLSFLEDYKKSVEFQHKSIHKNHYLITKDKKVIASFSLYRPTHRSILVKTNGPWIKSLLFLTKLFKKNSNKLSWVYISNFYINESAREDKKLIGKMIASLRSQRMVKPTDLLLMLYRNRGESCYNYKESSAFFYSCPQFISKATLFQVEDSSANREFCGDVLLDPAQL